MKQGMKVLIIEDEKPAAEKLRRLLTQIDDGYEVVGELSSVKKAVQWLQASAHEFDLIFLDIQLSDGQCFDIFKHVKVDKPVIFTTAYNEYAMEAFRVNSIDYLLKPITKEKLEGSLSKLQHLRDALAPTQQAPDFEQLNAMLASLKKRYKKRFMVKAGEHIRSLTDDKIAFFFAEGRYVFLYTQQGQRFIIDYNLEELDTLLDPALFFRANRSMILQINAIAEVLVHSNSRLKVLTSPKFEKEIIVSRDKVSPFKDWFNGAS